MVEKCRGRQINKKIEKTIFVRKSRKKYCKLAKKQKKLFGRRPFLFQMLVVYGKSRGLFNK